MSVANDIAALKARCTALESRCTQLEARVTKAEANIAALKKLAGVAP